MKVLYIGSIQPTACATFYADAAEALGHEVRRFDPGFFVTDGFIDKNLLRLRKGPSGKKMKDVASQLEGIVREFQPQLIMNIAENFISAEAIQRAKDASPGLRWIYHSHDNNFAKGILKPTSFFHDLRHYDQVFTTKSQNVARYQALGQSNTTFIPSAYEPRVHRPVPASESRFGETQFEITFIGTYDRSRDGFLEAVGWDHLYVWGDRWNRFKGFKAHQDHIVPKAIYHPDFADVLSHSKVTLGLLREEAEDRHTQRTFEIPACESLQIAPRNSEILSFFEEDKEIVCFETLEELKEKSLYYLANPKERDKIVANGKKRLLAGKHTYQDRVKTMIELTGLT